jgi:integrase
MTLLAPTLQAFFTQRLITQRNASPHTIASYRDTFRLLLAFAQQHTGKPPGQLDFDDLDAPLIGAFLTHLEHDRHNSARTRNNRLAAIHSLYRYAALEHPEHAATIARVIAIPKSARAGWIPVGHSRNVAVPAGPLDEGIEDGLRAGEVRDGAGRGVSPAAASLKLANHPLHPCGRPPVYAPVG